MAHRKSSLLVLALPLMLAACGGLPTNRALTSVHQPVVTHNAYALDLTTGPGGLSAGEAKRLDGWFEAMNLRYGDRIAVDDPLHSEAVLAAVADVAARRGIAINRQPAVHEGFVQAGSARVVLTRAAASVPGCPDWNANAEFNPHNATSTNFGCAVNGNLAAMVADPEHLVSGARGKGQTVVMTSNKAIDAYRAAKPTGEGGTLTRKVSTQSGGN
ncbi:pilus assembly protein CpaD [Novosphingobium umbonatum]|uniref:Pilus assembly protein CpaD n=1 Tax=Novosphingobium umbonatum TaxID=1908524 RepID=A0A3S2USP4_9SPHN|nr:CpaD family pilus assembly lipoprotein [Novosphingobium umbonatum]RVU03826.1 pilus assembly protein CpaD [Novosphingobium umbonatum]